MCLSNLVFLPLNISSSPYFPENMHDFRPPRFLHGCSLRLCFSGVDAPDFGLFSSIVARVWR